MKRSKSNLARWWWLPLLIVVVGVGIVLAMGPGGGSDEQATNVPLYEVKSGPLTISVLTSGTLRSAEAEIVKSEVEGRPQILYLVPEGTRVEAGDLLVELDASEREDERIEEEIETQNAEASWIQAREALEVAKMQAKADIQAAEVELELAELALEKYTAEKGEYTQMVQEAKTQITNLEAELEQAAETLRWSKALAEEGFITATELTVDELSHQKTQGDLELARSDLELLEEYTRRGTVAELQNAVDQAEFSLMKAELEANSNVIDAEATLRSRKAQYDQEKANLEDVISQIEKCKIYAPVGGMVIYATSGESSRRGNDEPLQEGREVREREELIHLPTVDNMMADVKIHESMVDKVHVGLPVRVTTDAAPGQHFNAKLTKLAVLPDAQSWWSNPDMKVYNAEIEITDSSANLRSGMSCNAEVIIDRYDDTMYVPVQAVTRVGDQPTVYVWGPNGAEPRPVEVGLDNNRMIRIIDGLAVGERVLLTPPLPPSSRQEDEEGGEEAGETGGEVGPGAETGQQPGDVGRRQGGGEGAGQDQRPEREDGEDAEDGGFDLERLENLSEEERQNLRDRFENLSDEDRENLQRRMRERGGGQQRGGPGGGDSRNTESDSTETAGPVGGGENTNGES